MTASRKKLALWIVLGMVFLGTVWYDAGARREHRELVVESGQLAQWLNEGNVQRVRQIALTNPPQSVYEVGDFLIEEGSPKAVSMLRSLCDSPEGALVVAELAEKLPVPEALPFCRDLLADRDQRVRHVALCTLFEIAARRYNFAGPWPEGIDKPSGSPEAIRDARERWRRDQPEGTGGETFEEWTYKEAVSAFLCADEPESRLGRKSEETLVKQLDAELIKEFGFRIAAHPASAGRSGGIAPP